MTLPTSHNRDFYGQYKDYYGYIHIYAPNHSRAHKDGFAKRCLVNAEKALGKPLPLKIEIHHLDENKENDTNSNLVICEDAGYHKLIHSRQRIFNAGGHPDTHKICSNCKILKERIEFNKNSCKFDNLDDRCRKCKNALR